MITIFSYIASNDSDAARAIINKYGYEVQDVQSAEDLGACLEQLVAAVGEPAMLDIYAIHPDRDQLMQLYSSNTAVKKDDCDCHKKSQKSIKSYISQITGNNNNQIQICIIAAAFLLSAAIISKS